MSSYLLTSSRVLLSRHWALSIQWLQPLEDFLNRINTILVLNAIWTVHLASVRCGLSFFVRWTAPDIYWVLAADRSNSVGPTLFRRKSQHVAKRFKRQFLSWWEWWDSWWVADFHYHSIQNPIYTQLAQPHYKLVTPLSFYTIPIRSLCFIGVEFGLRRLHLDY